jgi:hypothetical protein
MSTAKWHSNRVTIALRSSGDAVSASQHEVCLSWTSHIHITHFAHHCHLRINCVVSELIWSDLICSTTSKFLICSRLPTSKFLLKNPSNLTIIPWPFADLNFQFWIELNSRYQFEFLGFFKLKSLPNDRPRRRGPLQELSERGEKMMIWCDKREERWYDHAYVVDDESYMHACLLALFIILIREILKAFGTEIDHLFIYAFSCTNVQ